MLLRAFQLRKAMLVEGLPGVGKTALVGALASRARVPLVSYVCKEFCVKYVSSLVSCVCDLCVL